MKNEMRLAAQQKQKIVPAPTGVKKLSSLAGQEVVTKEQTTALSKKLIELNEVINKLNEVVRIRIFDDYCPAFFFVNIDV